MAQVELEPVVGSTLHPSGVLEIWLNRPKKFNSLDTEMLKLINAALESNLGSASRCTGILLTAVEGRAFSAGADIKHIASLSREEKVMSVQSLVILWMRWMICFRS